MICFTLNQEEHLDSLFLGYYAVIFQFDEAEVTRGATPTPVPVKSERPDLNPSPVVRRQVGQKSTVHRCPECGQTFGFKSSLKTHMKVHAKETPFSCPDYGKGFSKSALHSHTRIHTGEKPFHCSVCNKRFAQQGNSNLLRHVMTNHIGEKPYICSVCGKRFTLKGYLQKHMKTHAKHGNVHG
uniref:C2H2-type domain-containing protein n=1 Tax=Sphaeramia orbicularis TaxID=375764 RepID=A0A673BV27_9TELE